MKKSLLAIGLAVATVTAASAQIAQDKASNYVTFNDTSNGGTGFLPWSITTSGTGSAGTFLGDSSLGAGNINTDGESFGLFANPTGTAVNANRAFATSLVTGNILTFQLALNFDNGNKGFDLFAGTQGQVFNFNVSLGGSVGSSNATLVPGIGAGYDYGGNDAVIDITLTLTSPTSLSYDISRISSQGNQGSLFNGTVTGLTEGVSGFGLYVDGTDAGGLPQNNLYANNFTVVPEPGTVALLALGATALAFRIRRRRHSIHF